MVIVPSLAPKQDSFVTKIGPTTSGVAAGTGMLTAVAAHPLLSTPVTLYVPACNPNKLIGPVAVPHAVTVNCGHAVPTANVGVAVTVYSPVPPDPFTTMLPSLPGMKHRGAVADTGVITT